MASSTTMDGGKSAQERMQARAPEMELIREAQSGSRAAFDALVRQYEHQVLRLALHLTGSEHDAEDIYQEAFFEGLPVHWELPFRVLLLHMDLSDRHQSLP
jgi:RNA polymerase sigma-70 factor (ECF subfamily)